MNKLKKFFIIWTDDKGLLFLLISITILIFFVYPLSGNSELSSFVTNLFLIVILFSGLMSVDIKPIHRKILLITITLIIILDKVGQIYEQNIFTRLHIFSRILFLWIIIVLIFKRVFSDNIISFFYRIAGSITIYLLIGFIWANMYYFFYHINPDSIHFATPVNPEVNLMYYFIYFSFESLTTLGLGDIVPIHPMLKSLVILEAALGPLYLAILIGRLVSKKVRPKE